MARITETINLPTEGLLGGPSEVTIQNMTVAEERLLLGSSTDKAIDDIIKKCVVDSDKIELDKLTIPDKYFILVRIRILTYGTEYPITVRCPDCGHEFDYKVDLSDMDVNELPDEFTEPWTITLPQSKDELSLKIPRSKDLDAVDGKVKKHMKKFPMTQGDVSYNYRLMTNIALINGEEVSDQDLFNYINEMSGRDSSYFRKQIDKIKIGYDTELNIECPKCAEEVEVRLPMTSDFFHSEFED